MNVSRERGIILPVILLSFTLAVLVILAPYVYINLLKVSSRTKSVSVIPSTKTPLIFKIAFLRAGDIWLADENGSNQLKITTDGGINGFKWLPKTTKFAYYSNINHLDQVKIIDWVSHQEFVVHKIAEPNLNSADGRPSEDNLTFYLTVSPDGKKLAYSEGLIFPNKGFTVYDIVTKTEQSYTNCGEEPVFSQDATTVASMQWPNVIACDLYNGKVNALTTYVYPPDHSIDTSTLAYLSSVIGWSLNGKEIYYVVSNRGSGNYAWTTISNILAVNVETRQISQVTNFLPGKYAKPVNFVPERNIIYTLDTDNVVFDAAGNKAGDEIKTMAGYRFDKLGYVIRTSKSIQKINLATTASNELFIPQYKAPLWDADYQYTISPDERKAIFVIFTNNSATSGRNDILQLNIGDKSQTMLIQNADMPQWVYN